MATRVAPQGRAASRLKFFFVCCLLLLIGKCELAPRSAIGTATQTLAVHEEPDRVVLAWSGPIQKPMRDQIAAALEKLAADPRRVVLSLNSPGGSLVHGREVVATIREAAKRRPIDTLVEEGAVCASMCVPIYLNGAQRKAAANAHFLFHEAKFDPSAEAKAAPSKPIDDTLRKTLEQIFTADLYENDIGGQRVNAQWLAEMRKKIQGRDVWVSGQQLMDEGSGVVDALAPAAAR
jgi:ATP-dependent protease ClpP protease subunit